MAQFGRDTWRRTARSSRSGSASSAGSRRSRPSVERRPGAARRTSRRLRIRSFASGLLEPGGDLESLTLAALSTAGILFDGLSQTQQFFDCSASRRSPSDAPAVRVARADQPGARGRPDRRHPAARSPGSPDRARLPDRPLLHGRAVRRPADRARSSPTRSGSAGTSSASAGFEPATGCCPARSSGPAARRRGRRPCHRRLGGPCRGRPRGRRPGRPVSAAEARAVRLRQVPLALLMVFADGADALVARPERRRPAGRAGRSRRRAARRDQPLTALGIPAATGGPGTHSPSGRTSARRSDDRRDRAPRPRRPRSRSPSGTGSPRRSPRGGSRPRRGPRPTAASGC